MLASRVFLFALLVAAAFTACTANPAATPTTPATIVPITSYGMVAGQWQGLVSGISTRRADESDSVQVTIGGDGGYKFATYRTIGAFEGSGTFALRDGKLVTEHEGRPTTLTFYERDGRRWLKGDGVMRNGVPITVDLRPAR